MTRRTSLVIPLTFVLLMTLLLAIRAAAEPAPPSLFGVTAWQGWSSGQVQVGVAIPLARWHSIFRGVGEGELVTLLSKDEAGLGIGHRFRSVKLELGSVSVGAALGVGGVFPLHPAPGRPAGLRATRPVVFVTLPIVPK